MKKTILFKTLIDILFFCLCLTSISALLVVPLGLGSINMDDQIVENWDLFSILIIGLSIISYALLIIGIYFLRKVARLMLNERYFQKDISLFLKKSGNYLIISSIASILMLLIAFARKILFSQTLELLYDSDKVLILFILIIGFFFNIQASIIKKSISLKQENDLTI